MTVGDRIKRKREEKGISQTALAEMVGISKQTLYKYENNIVTNIPSDKIEKIADIFKVSAAYIMGWEDNLTPENADLTVDMLTMDSRVIKYIKRLTELSSDQQEIIFNMIDALSKKAEH